ncbi:MAG: hypothetical protein C4589_02760 [Peptococcaceae bacterium]|nr:MAG: hypothetical protein C4589_02760 [Peptococcaceae bacterium]
MMIKQNAGGGCLNEKNVLAALVQVRLALFLVPVMAMVVAGLITMFLLPPVYRATTTLLVFKQPEDANLKSLSFNRSLVRTYSELAKSRLVLEEVLKNKELDMVPHLDDKIKVEPVPDTELIRISAEDANPTLAALIANEVARALTRKINDTMSMSNIQVIDAALPPAGPVWPNHLLSILFAGILGLVAVVGFILARDYISGVQGNRLAVDADTRADKAETGPSVDHDVPEESDRLAP